MVKLRHAHPAVSPQGPIYTLTFCPESAFAVAVGGHIGGLTVVNLAEAGPGGRGAACAGVLFGCLPWSRVWAVLSILQQTTASCRCMVARRQLQLQTLSPEGHQWPQELLL